MKTLKLVLLSFIIMFAAKAQNADKFNAAMKKGLILLDSAQTSEQFTDCANYFERIANIEQKQWLAQYYVSYSNIMAAITSTGTKEVKDALYDKALNYATKADALTPDNSEVYVLKGYATFMKMSVDPQVRAMSMIPQAGVLLQKAITLNPENPRAYLVLGQDTFYTPEAFGGGKAKAKPFLATGADKYAKENVKGLEPGWGKGRCAALLKQCE
jgi:tetratricopeptide (TPR) repeat protein